jgi:O-antigen/teichoic acid export membrane protein
LTGLGLAGVLIPKLGYIGAALATLCAQLASLLSVFFISQRLHPIRLDYFKLVTVLAVGGTLLFLLWLVEGRLLVQCLVGVGFGMLLVWTLRRNLRELRSGL